MSNIDNDNILIYTDGSVYRGPVGCGACSAVLYSTTNSDEACCYTLQIRKLEKSTLAILDLSGREWFGDRDGCVCWSVITTFTKLNYEYQGLLD